MKWGLSEGHVDPELGQMRSLISYSSPLTSTSCHDGTSVRLLWFHSKQPTEAPWWSERIPGSGQTPALCVVGKGSPVLGIRKTQVQVPILPSNGWVTLRTWPPLSGSSGEGDGIPLQSSRLENPMDRGAWRAAVHGLAKSRTRLSDVTFTSRFHALEKEMATHSSVLAWRIPGTGEPGGLPSLGSHRVGHDWSDLAAAASSQLWARCSHKKGQGFSAPFQSKSFWV